MVCKLHSGKNEFKSLKAIFGMSTFLQTIRYIYNLILHPTCQIPFPSSLQNSSPQCTVAGDFRRRHLFFSDSSSLSSSPLFTLPPYLQLPVTPRKEKVKEKNDTDEEAIDAENHRDSRRGSNLIHHAQPKSPSHSRLLSAFSKTVTSLFDFPRHLPLADRIVFVVS